MLADLLTCQVQFRQQQSGVEPTYRAAGQAKPTWHWWLQRPTGSWVMLLQGAQSGLPIRLQQLSGNAPEQQRPAVVLGGQACAASMLPLHGTWPDSPTAIESGPANAALRQAKRKRKEMGEKNGGKKTKTTAAEHSRGKKEKKRTSQCRWAITMQAPSKQAAQDAYCLAI